MTSKDVRWIQRLKNFKKAFAELDEAVSLSRQRELTKLEKQGLIQAFEYTHELAWNTLKDYFINQGNTQITGSKDATREAFKVGLIEDGEGWMSMVTSRNLTSHTYNQETAKTITSNILENYFKLFQSLLEKLDSRVELEKND